ncbi:MAG: protein transporter [Pirellulaceae bacterium]|nr:protein transporter [Pirellulaceae bacterium]
MHAVPLDGPAARVGDIFVETDIREAIQSLASQADVSVVIDETVNGAVTATIQNEPFDLALRKVLLPLGLHFSFQDGQYLICSSDPESSMFSMIAQRIEYRPMHSSPEELTSLLMLKDQQFVRVATSRNMIIIEAPESVARHIQQELTSLDQPVPQVVLEAMVVVVSPDSKFQFGMDIGQNVYDGDRTFNLSLDGLALSGNLSSAAARDLFGKFSVTSHFLRSLEQEGYVSIRATPHVMAKNGEKAEISIARETFFSTQPIDSQLFLRQDIQKVEAGITMELTPTIRGDNVTMVIDRAEVSEDIRSTINDSSLADPYPLINRRRVSTTVHVKDGETVVIGGLMQNQMIDRVSKVPFFGDLPVFGKVFQKIEQQEEAAEVVVFISPRIVRDQNFGGEMTYQQPVSTQHSTPATHPGRATTVIPIKAPTKMRSRSATYRRPSSQIQRVISAPATRAPSNITQRSRNTIQRTRTSTGYRHEQTIRRPYVPASALQANSLRPE